MKAWVYATLVPNSMNKMVAVNIANPVTAEPRLRFKFCECDTNFQQQMVVFVMGSQNITTVLFKQNIGILLTLTKCFW